MKKIIVLTLALLLSFSFYSCGENSADGDENVSDNSSAQTEAKPKEKEKAYAIGDTVLLDDWEFSIESVEVVQSVEDEFLTFTPDEDTNQFLAASISMKNTNSEKKLFNPPIVQKSVDAYATLICNEKYEYDPTMLMGYEEDLNNVTVNPLSTKTGKLHFSYPKELGNATDDMVIRFTSGGKTANITLK